MTNRSKLNKKDQNRSNLQYSHMTMTVMTDDSFLNLKGKETLVYILIYIILISIIHRFFNNCHLSSVIPE